MLAVFAGLALLQCFGHYEAMTLMSDSHKSQSARARAVENANARTNSYYWPSGRGHVGHYSASLHEAPIDLKSSLAWSWHDPRGRYRNSPCGVNLDDRQNIYLTSLDGIRKFTVNGTLLWSYTPEREEGEEMPDTASLYDGAVYCSTTHGRLFALSMETGKEIWKTKLASTDGNNGWVSAFDGVVLTGSDASDLNRGRRLPSKSGDQLVTGLNATDGAVMWTFKPEAPVWNFIGSFAGDGTFVFQDYEGRAYRNRLSDGRNLWTNGGRNDTWTDGGALLGPNGVVYAVNTHHMDPAGANAPGDVSAYSLADGKLLWKTTVPRVPNNMPAIGRLAGKKGLSLVQPIGQQCMQGMPTDVYALDAETGAVQWVFKGPTQIGPLVAGDGNLQAMRQRQESGVRPITLPNPWSAPTIDARGTVYIGNENGPLYSLRDENGDGKVAGKEVSTFQTKACFVGSSSPAIGENMMAIASIDALYVFKG